MEFGQNRQEGMGPVVVELAAVPTSPRPPPERELVYAESAYKGQFVHDPDAVGEFKLRFHRLQAAAMPPSRSLRLVEETIEGFPP
ncbi:Scr1 family TA system antitoxin-like transcriptional regulator [Nocardiopsis sp. M1B1]|uniref:Scr1 family TA system antitoxin-like transcriptional regulator n=1 Tax=Nocardiopsis sp. M1B1 TaxID=3450454 RepID=UPI0040398C03